MELKDILWSEFLGKLYPEGLEWKVEVSNVEISNLGPAIICTLVFDQIPKEIPRKWDKEANRVAIKLRFFDVRDMLFEKFGTTNFASVDHSQTGGLHQFHLRGEEVDLKFKCEWVAFVSANEFRSTNRFGE